MPEIIEQEHIDRRAVLAAVVLVAWASCLAQQKSIEELFKLALEAGDFDQALKYQDKAVSSTKVPDSRKGEMHQRLELYRQRKPYREPAPNNG